jgi:hypothetical protein
LLLEADIKNTCFYAVWFSVTLRASLDTISEVFGALSEKIEKKWSTSIMLVERGEVCHPGRTKEQELKSCKQAMQSELKDSAQEMTSRMRKVMELTALLMMRVSVMATAISTSRLSAQLETVTLQARTLPLAPCSQWPWQESHARLLQYQSTSDV